MEIGVVFPQTELGGDRGAVRAYGQAVADLGYAHVAAYDHVLGADTAVHGDIGGPYDVHDTFHEPLMLFSYFAGFTELRFVTSILIGPQRQTALLAKQAAELDILCGGRSGSGSASGGIAWSTRHSATRSPTGAPSWRSRWACCASSGRRRA
jgi:alkanesulfonate monooxygenase SsuD/methylene tetrahydromethanopterin reductase-like flavin-dependent oxidoreductase (luciferase family)